MIGHVLASNLHAAFSQQGFASKQVTMVNGAKRYNITGLIWCDTCDEFHLETEPNSHCYDELPF